MAAVAVVVGVACAVWLWPTPRPDAPSQSAEARPTPPPTATFDDVRVDTETLLDDRRCRLHRGGGAARDAATAMVTTDAGARFVVLDGSGPVFAGALRFPAERALLGRRSDSALAAAFGLRRGSPPALDLPAAATVGFHIPRTSLGCATVASPATPHQAEGVTILRTDLQARADRAAKLFTEKARKPLVVEFAGVPKAGKTTILSHVQTFLKRCGFRTDVVVERASVCPIRDKKHANFNVWTACTTLAQVLEKTQNPPRPDDPHILFLDRGLFDSICWMTMMEQISRIRAEDRKLIQRFLTMDDWRKRISAVFVMLASPQDSMDREKGLLPVEGAEGSIMNPHILEKIKDVNEQCIEQLGREFRLFPVNTSVGETKDNPTRTAEVVVETILALAEGHVEESILSCPKPEVTGLFVGRCFIDKAQAAALVSKFQVGGSYRPRNEVEKDNTVVQALPIVVVRNADGDVLRLRRREKSPDNPLHEKIVIWAGGHVRCEDAVNGDPLLHCAVRELEEELRLQVAPSALRLLGAVYFGNGESTSRHIGIAYEWRANTNDVSAVLSRSEFFEKSGTSLSGSFCSVDQLAKDVRCKQLTEPWSVEVIRNALAKDGMEDLLTRDHSA